MLIDLTLRFAASDRVADVLLRGGMTVDGGDDDHDKRSYCLGNDAGSWAT